jgi:transcriptional regulator with XRE-family HTH domain
MGERIRILRTQKGIGLNVFAAQLNISASYLSNLETGKTDTIQLSLLEKLQDELSLLPIENFHFYDQELDIRLQQAVKKLKELEKSHPDVIQYLLTILEHGLEFFQNKK